MRLSLFPAIHVVLSLLSWVTSSAKGEELLPPYLQLAHEEMNLQRDDDPYLPTFLPTPNNVTFLSGEEAVLQCAIENRGTRTIVWRRASEPNPLTIGEDTFVGDKRFYVRHRKHSLEWNLHIREATPQDSGVYECQVIMRSRDIRQMILLRVEDTPFIPPQKPDIQISGSQFVEKGNTLTLTCNATGFDYPPDELDWFKDGLKLTSDLRRTLRKDVSLAEKTIVSKLQIARATMADAGTYVCRASDMQVTSAKVNVLNTDTVNEKRESKDQSTLWPFGSRGGVGGPLTFNAVVLLLCVALSLCAS